MVSEAPTSAMPPKVSAAAASAMPSGSRRARGVRKISSSIAAMTTSAATSRSTIESCSEVERSATTTGAPVTV